ncbi:MULTISPECIES: MaoC family dehydratase [Nocardia]|uniref:Acyl dehydratase n=2 Tax=Nocardia TaxID=1817 RepID=A0A4R6P0C6_NOCIG|nr:MULTISPECIES: MaoC family dehydratase [Nocardia]NKX87044.1 MaoC family dehydratase [Nocardia coubleae]TDP31088.1 acyl dehydratase [Nocardia ignorata]
MRIFQGVAELEGAVGTHLGYSGWHTITQAQINAFADATGDHQWIHIDTEKAAAGPFGTTIAHGYLTLSLLPLLVPQVYRVEGVQMAVNYGANKLRFPAPVPVDSKVRAGIELVSVAAGAAGHLVTSRVTVEREGGDKPVCVVESLTLVVA